MKSQRQQKILEIIDKYDIGTQEELIMKLEEFGYSVTQTTISRDIRQLKLVKGLSGSGAYKYIAPKAKGGEANNVVLNAAITDSVTKIEAAQNLVVIKTLPGMANAVAVCVETLDHPYIVGSVAGDDTLLLVMKDNSAAAEVEARLKISFQL